MITPKIHLVAFEDRQTRFIFVAIPNERGRYLRTDKSVAMVPCPMCKSVIGEPCKTGSKHENYGGTTHAVRRSAVQAQYRHLVADDVIARSELPPPVPDEWMEASS